MNPRRFVFLALSGLSLALLAPPVGAEKASVERLAALAQPVRGSLTIHAPNKERLEAKLRSPDLDLDLDLSLSWHSDRAPGAAVFVRGERGKREQVELPLPMTLRGQVEGVPGALVAATLSERGLSAVIFLPDGVSLAIEPEGQGKANGHEHPVRLSPLVGGKGAGCGHAEDDSPDFLAAAERGATATRDTCSLPGSCPTGNPPACGGLCKAEIAYDTDYELYVALGSSVNAVIAFIDARANVLNTQYESQVGISHQIVHYEVRTSADDGYAACEDPNADPPYCCGSQSCLLGQLSSRWANDPELAAIDRDLVHLLTGEGAPGGSPAGVGHYGSVCGSNAYSWSYQNSEGSCTQQTVQNHEIGHNWDAQHTLTGTMNPFGGCSLQFASCSISQIGCYRETIAPLCLEPLVAPNSLDPAWVDFAYTGPEHGSEAQPFRTLARAVDAVVEDGTVRIKAGVSSETMTIAKGMTLRAEGGAVSIGL